MSRYKDSRIAVNNNEMYSDLFEERGVKKITQFRSFSFKKIPQEVLDSIQTESYVWKYGDTFSSLASKYYADSKMWWIIAGYNRKPTESLLKIGDTIKIPLSIAEAMRVL